MLVLLSLGNREEETSMIEVRINTYFSYLPLIWCTYKWIVVWRTDLAYSGHWPTYTRWPVSAKQGGVQLGTKPLLSLLLLMCFSVVSFDRLTACGFYPRPGACDFYELAGITYIILRRGGVLNRDRGEYNNWTWKKGDNIMTEQRERKP